MPSYPIQIYYGMYPPSIIPGLRPGDIYYQTDTGDSLGTVVAEWEFSFSARAWAQVPYRAHLTSWTNLVW